MGKGKPRCSGPKPLTSDWGLAFLAGAMAISWHLGELSPRFPSTSKIPEVVTTTWTKRPDSEVYLLDL
jgi:hypothetical protein